MAPEADGKRSEETWRPIFDRLQERFPDVGANKIATILLENNGHAGQAAAALRDLCGTGKREVDPDDQEHVKTLLTSPVMFAALCKENFRKFDVNGDGVLSWTEVLPLVNTLYESFGLQPPREGNLRSFFDATDLNKDGVLSEREFKKFFECFLRYAFFDVVQAKGKSESLRELETSPNKRSRPSRDETSDDQRRVSPQKDRGYEPNRHEKGARTSAGSPQGRSRPFKVIAPHGISWRRSPELADRLEQNVPYGEVVQVLEHWVKTDHGWLPVHDTRGKLLIQPVPVPLSKDEALAAVQRSKVLKGLSIHGQVRVAALLRRTCYQPGERLWSAQEGEVQEKRLVLIERGDAELWLPEADGERFVGLIGPTKVLGGLFAVGSASRQVFSARVPEGDDAKPLHAWEIEASDLEQFESLFNAADLCALRRRVLQDVRIQLMPYLQRQLASGGVFSRYSSQFIGQLVKDMDLRLFEPGQVIFKEKSLGRSIGILVSGCVDIIANGRKVMSKSDSGQEIGEAALFESAYRRHATTRCSQSCETLMFLASRDAFYACLAKFPEEKIKLSVQVRHRISMTVLKEPFHMCDPAFLHLVCTECEVVHLTWPKTATSPEQDEVMHLCYTGDLVVEEENSEVPSRFAKKWEIFGLRAALGLRTGPPEYKLMAGRRAVRWSRSPGKPCSRPCCSSQISCHVCCAWLDARKCRTTIPSAEERRWPPPRWDIIQPLMCRVFCNLEIDHEFCHVLAPHFKASVYDAGCLITPEAGPSRSLLLLVSGEICWSRQGIVSYVATAPDYFDEACLFSERGHCANITAKSTAVIWRLHVNALHLPADSPYAGRARRLLMEVEELTEDIHGKLRSNMRNMKTWRRFNSEVLGLLSDNIFLRTYLPGQCIFSDGDAGEFIYILMRGRVEVQSQGESSFLEEGITFGEMVLFGQAHRSATITACCLCIINAVHKDLVSHALRMQPRKAFLVDKPQQPPSGRVKGTEDKALRPARPREKMNQYAEWQAIEDAQRQRNFVAVPRRLQQRLERSFLLQGQTPRLPPVESRLYKAPKVTEMNLRTAFDHMIPRHVIVASSDMLGIRGGYVHKVKQLGLDDSLSSFRVPRATYTEPIQRRMAAQRNAKRKAAAAATAAEKAPERPQTLTVLGDLQALAASLLRLSSKPSISHLLATDPHAPTMPRPPQPRRLPRLSGYSRSLAQSARAYDGRSSRGSKIADVAEETETPSPVILNYSDVSPVGSSSDQTNEDQPDEVPAASTELAELKAATWCARRLAYECYEAQMQRAQWPAILLSSSEESEALLQLDVYLEDAGLDGVSSAGTVQSVSVVDSVTFTPEQVSPSSSCVHSISAEDVVSYLVNLQ